MLSSLQVLQAAAVKLALVLSPVHMQVRSVHHVCRQWWIEGKAGVLPDKEQRNSIWWPEADEKRGGCWGLPWSGNGGGADVAGGAVGVQTEAQGVSAGCWVQGAAQTEAQGAEAGCWVQGAMGASVMGIGCQMGAR